MLSLFSFKNHNDHCLNFKIDTNTDGNIVYGSHQQIYQDITVIKNLSKTEMPVYLVKSNFTKNHYNMKVYFHEKDHQNLGFMNTRRFGGLRHQNIIKHLFFEDDREVVVDNLPPLKASYIITECVSHGSFIDFIKNCKKSIDDKLVRTYFRHLINGLEYLHSNGVSHMDLKLGSLYLDENYILKIGDFEKAHFETDFMIISEGKKLFRAPEVISGGCKNTKTADIYSAGIILFVLKTKGVIPQFEDELIEGIHFADLLKNDPNTFWTYHLTKQQVDKTEFDQEFRALFEAMTKFDVEDRASILEIKASGWYNGAVYTDEELGSKMKVLHGQDYCTSWRRRDWNDLYTYFNRSFLC